MSKSSTSSTPYTQRIGRGGAGNIIRAGAGAISPPSTTIIPSNTRKSPSSHRETIHTGRGGIGNIRRIPSEKRLFSFDEELALQLQRAAHPAPIYHVGRGGAGNITKTERVYIDGSSRRRESNTTDSSSEKSERSGSAPRNIMRKIGRTVGKAGDYFVG